jgi:hypothetical protein
MNIDERYSALSALVALKGKTLAQLAAPLQDCAEYIGLSYAAYCVENNWPRHGAVDCYDYLGTLNAFAERIADVPHVSKSLSNKLLNGRGSSFLDTVAEAAWFIYFEDAGYHPSAERPFEDVTKKNPKDADIFVSIDGRPHWLDVKSVQFKKEWESPLGEHNLSWKLGEKAQKKYHEKFGVARQEKLLADGVVGILLCVLKEDLRVWRSIFSSLRPLSPPSTLFGAEDEGLDFVWIHDLAPHRHGGRDIALPRMIADWRRP